MIPGPDPWHWPRWAERGPEAGSSCPLWWRAQPRHDVFTGEPATAARPATWSLISLNRNVGWVVLHTTTQFHNARWARQALELAADGL